MTQDFKIHPVVRTVGRLSAMSCAALIAMSAQAQEEPNPYFIGIKQVLTHDSNVFRVNDGPSDSYSTTSLLGGFDQKISRQRVYLNANIARNLYRNETELNNTSYGVNTGWDWETIENLSGTLTAGLNRSLASQTDSSTAPQNVSNQVTTQHYGATARWGGESILTLEGAYAHNKVTYSETSTSDSDGDTASVGLYYRPGAALRLGTALRYSRAETPFGATLADGTLGPNTETGKYLDLLADWRPTSQTSLNTRVSWARQSNSQVDSRDFSGLTGALIGTYAPTAKVSLNATLSRDAGVNGTFFTLNPSTPATPGVPAPTPVRGLSESSQITNSASLGATYEATSKISVKANAHWRHAKLVDSAPIVGTTTLTTYERNDNSRLYSLGLTWAIARGWDLGCSYSHSTRDLDASPITQGISYSANVASCYAQFMLR
jgi:hypothetical protein